MGAKIRVVRSTVVEWSDLHNWRVPMPMELAQHITRLTRVKMYRIPRMRCRANVRIAVHAHTMAEREVVRRYLKGLNTDKYDFRTVAISDSTAEKPWLDFDAEVDIHLGNPRTKFTAAVFDILEDIVRIYGIDVVFPRLMPPDMYYEDFVVRGRNVLGPILVPWGQYQAELRYGTTGMS